MNITLVGFMGSGKTTVGKLLAEELSRPFADMDELIEKKQQKTIGKIFEEKGETEFRKIERKTLLEILNKKNYIIAAGGGTPCFYDNIEVIKKNSLVFYLKASAVSLFNRLRADTRIHQRPLLKGFSSTELLDYIKKNLAEREPFYQQAYRVIHTEQRSVKEIRDEIANELRFSNKGKRPFGKNKIPNLTP